MNDILDAARRIKELGFTSAREGRDPVNQPMINNWAEAIGGAPWDSGLAPPAMIQVWTMRGLHPTPTADDPLQLMSTVLDEAGFTSVVATNCEQAYHRYVRVGEHLTVQSRLVDVVGPKRTSLGEGWFITTESVWRSGDEAVAAMTFRILKYKPKPKFVMRPAITADTVFFWAGTKQGELRIQSCVSCGQLRHPPGPMCPSCGGDPTFIVASGLGTVYSYVVHHHPPVPGRDLPFVVVLVELDEGVRVLGPFAGDRVAIGQRVKVSFERVDDQLTMPVWEAT